MGRLLPFSFAALRDFNAAREPLMLLAMLGYSQKDIRARGSLKGQGEGLSSGAPRGAPSISYLLAYLHILPRQVCLQHIHPSVELSLGHL